MKKFLEYICKVWKWEEGIGKLRDPRRKPEVSKETIVYALVLLKLMRWKSLLNCDMQLKAEPNIAKLIGAEKSTVASDSTLSRALEWIEPEDLQRLWGGVLQAARRKKVHEKGTIGSLRVASLDMTTHGSSCKIKCDLCHGESKLTHKITFGYLLGEKPHMFLGAEVQKPNEGELDASRRLLRWIYKTTGNWIDVLTLDGLYKYSFIKDAKELGYDVVVKTEEERLLAIQQAEEIIKDQLNPNLEFTNKPYKYTVWDCPNIQVDGFDFPLRVLRVFQYNIREQTESFYWVITTLPPDKASTRNVCRIVRCRWHIENNAYHNSKTYWFFNHTLAHSSRSTINAIWLHIITFSFFMLFFYRHLFHLAKMLRDKKIMMVHLIPILERSLAAPT